MFYDDFLIESGIDFEDSCYPLENGYTANQLPDEYSVDQAGITGELVFYVPKESTGAGFVYQEYYTIGTSKESHKGNTYIVYLDFAEIG
jgi:hypothetical protein